MKYLEAKKQIKSGDIILWSGNGLAARIVRWATHSRWSHIGIAAWWGDRLMALDSYPFKGTRARLLSHDLKNAHWMPSGSDWNREAQGFALDELDRKYSYQNLWKTWLGLDLVGSEYHCAQYVAAVLEKAGLKFPHPADPETIAKTIGNKITELEGERLSSGSVVRRLQDYKNPDACPGGVACAPRPPDPRPGGASSNPNNH